jgi:hypothetical protein
LISESIVENARSNMLELFSPDRFTRNWTAGA